MHRGQHSKRDRAPLWAVHVFFVFLALGLLWWAWAMFVA